MGQAQDSDRRPDDSEANVSSSANQASMVVFHGSREGALLEVTLRGGGIADVNAWRTTRLWTPKRSANARMPRSSRSWALRISSNSSTRDLVICPP